MKTIICDAGPLIFLAKIGELQLISDVLRGEIIVLTPIVEEVLSDSAGTVELMRLRKFLETVTVIDYRQSNHPSQSLSESDRSVLNWAVENRADWLIADERLLRRIAREEKLEVIGTFGILIAAYRLKMRSASKVRRMIDDLIGKYDCRISISLYQRFMRELSKDSGRKS